MEALWSMPCVSRPTSPYNKQPATMTSSTVPTADPSGLASNQRGPSSQLRSCSLFVAMPSAPVWEPPAMSSQLRSQVRRLAPAQGPSCRNVKAVIAQFSAEKPFQLGPPRSVFGPTLGSYIKVGQFSAEKSQPSRFDQASTVGRVGESMKGPSLLRSHRSRHWVNADRLNGQKF